MAQIFDPLVQVASTTAQTVSLTITENTAGATIHYTLDGTTPTTSSPSIASGSVLLVARNVTLNVQAFSGTSSSSLITQTYSTQAAISTSSDFTLILKNDGTVWATGDNTYGQIGIGTASTTPQATPVQVKVNSTTPLTNIIAISSGDYASYAVDSSGHLWVWGTTANGAFGIPPPSQTVNYATQLPNFSGAIAVSAKDDHVLVLKQDGSVWAFGLSIAGDLGVGASNLTIVNPPTRVLGGAQGGTYLQNIVAIPTSYTRSMALDNQGNVWAFGGNAFGELGEDPNINGGVESFPIKVAGITGAVSIAAGSSNSYALLSDGTVKAWGKGGIGALGNGLNLNLQDSYTPQTVIGLSNIVALESQCAVDSSGNVYTWGDNSSGQLGVGVTGNFATVPVTVNLYGGTAPTLAIASGNNQTLKDGVLSSALTITATSGGSAASNAPVNFVVPSGYGLLTTATGTTPISGVVQTTTNSSGQASAYFVAEPGTFNGSAYSASNQIVAATEGTQTTFTATAVSDPLLNLTPGNYATAQTLSVYDTTSGASLYYTLDGSNPASSSTRHGISSGGTISITQNATVNIEAFYNSGASNLISAFYSIGLQYATDTPTLPQWGLILMVVLLFIAARSKFPLLPRKG